MGLIYSMNSIHKLVVIALHIREVVKYSQGIDVLGFHLTPLQILMFAWPFAWIVTLIFHLITLIYEFRKNKKKDEAINKINVINH